MAYEESALILKIQSLRDGVSATERKAADYILAHPREIIHLSIAELAQNCAVSEATVVRLCKRVGLSGYQALKVTLAQDLAAPIETMQEAITVGDTPGEVMEKVFQGAVHTLQYTSRILNSTQLTRAVDALDKADRVLVLGLGDSAPIAQYCAYKLLRLGLDAAVQADTHLQCVTAAFLHPGDVCLAISHSGASRDILDAVRLARKADATIIALTNIGRTPLSDMADIRLDTAAKNADDYPLAMISRIAQFALIDSIYTTLALRRGASQSELQHAISQALSAKKRN
ncbi:MAG: MurR/RpiR family transcriptional regulator [Clostridia bacterium]